MSKSVEPPKGKVVLGRWSLLVIMYCVPLDLTEDEILDQLSDSIEAPVSERALIRDRFYGGFKCEFADRRHVFFNAGQYTFLNPGANTPLDADDRAGFWKQLVDENRDTYLGDGPFTQDAPKVEPDAIAANG